MSPRAARWILWLAALAMLPLPMLLFNAQIPVTRYLLLAGVSAMLIVAEGSGQIPILMLVLFVAHALVYAAVLWLVCWSWVRVWERHAPSWLLPTTAALVLVGLALTIGFNAYVTPFAAVESRASLLSVLQ